MTLTDSERAEVCTGVVLAEVAQERVRQRAKWGAQDDNDPMTWITILSEEVGEAARAALDMRPNSRTGFASPADYRRELIQVAAVAVAMIESIDRREGQRP